MSPSFIQRWWIIFSLNWLTYFLLPVLGEPYVNNASGLGRCSCKRQRLAINVAIAAPKLCPVNHRVLSGEFVISLATKSHTRSEYVRNPLCTLPSPILAG